MESKVIEYILKIAEENNITKAAEKLYITQPALNQQLLKLEKELGTQLFHRSRTNWRPTEAGEVYLKNARDMLHLKKQTYQIINDMVSDKQGRLLVGFTPDRGISMFSAVYPDFHKEYPDITVCPQELSVRQQQLKISRGELDIGFQTLCDKHMTGDEYISIATEEILLVIPKGHPLSRLAAPPGAPFTTLDIKKLQYEPFVLMYQESTIRHLVDSIFEEAGFTPNVLFETASTSTIITMIQSRLCCGLIPYHYIEDGGEGLSCFSLPGRPAWNIMASYKKGSYLTHAARRFIEIASYHWS